jgi:hypothetical protein
LPGQVQWIISAVGKAKFFDEIDGIAGVAGITNEVPRLTPGIGILYGATYHAGSANGIKIIDQWPAANKTIGWVHGVPVVLW